MLTETDLQQIDAGLRTDMMRIDSSVVHELVKMVRELQAAICKHRDARGHERCWQNDVELYHAIGEPLPYDGGLPCREEFLGRCQEYYDQQLQGDIS